MVNQNAANPYINSVQLNGSAANVADVALTLGKVTNNAGQLFQSTHVNDPISTIIGGNSSTGGDPSANPFSAHITYGPNAFNAASVWGPGQTSSSVLVIPLPANTSLNKGGPQP